MTTKKKEAKRVRLKLKPGLKLPDGIERVVELGTPDEFDNVIVSDEPSEPMDREVAQWLVRERDDVVIVED